MKKNKEETINTLKRLFNFKIEQILEVNKKFENDLHRLEEMIDLKDSSNVNNIIYKSVLSDKESELNELEENFNLKQKEEIEKKQAEFLLAKQTVEEKINEKITSYKLELTESTKTKLLQILPPNTSQSTKIDFSAVDLKIKSKFDFNSTINSTLHNTTAPIETRQKQNSEQQ